MGARSQPMPKQPSAMKKAKAREWEARQQEKREIAALERERTRKAVEDREALYKWTQGKGRAREAAINNTRARLAGMGMENDPFGIMQLTTQRYDNNAAGLEELGDYSSAFSSSVLDDVIDQTQKSNRTKTQKQFNSRMGDNYADDLFSDTSDDQLLDAIVGEQYATAENDLKNAQARGQIMGTAYDRAMSDLTKQRGLALNDANEMGASVLNTNRNTLNSLRGRELDTIASLALGDSFDVADRAGRIEKRGQTLKSNLDSDLRKTIGGKKFFDINSIMGGANASMGAQGVNASPNVGAGTQALQDVFKQRINEQQGMF